VIAYQELRSRPSDFASVPVMERASLARPTLAVGTIELGLRRASCPRPRFQPNGVPEYRSIGVLEYWFYPNRIHHGGIGILTAPQFRETTHLDPCLTLGLVRELVRAL
jgi:hypothetical protein